jgi:hypothetical protein
MPWAMPVMPTAKLKSEFWLDRFKQINVTPNKVNGYGESGVTLYRRHMLQLEGGYIVLYDELEANKPVKWTTQFHAPYYTLEAQQSNNPNQQNFALKTDLGGVSASVFANSALNLNVHNKFYETAENWNKVTNDEGKIKDFC